MLFKVVSTTASACAGGMGGWKGGGTKGKSEKVPVSISIEVGAGNQRNFPIPGTLSHSIG